MSLGKLKSFIEIVEDIQQKDAEGFVTVTKTSLKRVRAYKEVQNRVSSADLTLFRFRAIPTLKITTMHGILCEGELYRIINVSNLGIYLEVLAKKEDKDGESSATNT